MEQDRSFERRYSINVARLKEGRHEETFEFDHEFFEYMESDLVSQGKVDLTLKLTKYSRHIDARFHFHGQVEIPCDRCGQPYPQPIEEIKQIIYSFDDEMKFDGYEVIYVDPSEPFLQFVQEAYDFIHLALPMRRVPDESIHLCSPDVLELLGLDAQGNPLPDEEPEPGDDSDEPVDERWAALKKLRDQMDD